MIQGIVNTYILYQIIKRLALPFNNWNAFETGVIDDKGNILIKYDKRTEEQKNSFTRLDVFILNLKKLLGPFANNKIATFSAALFLLKEDNITEENITENFRKFIENLTEEEYNQILKSIEEDAPTNSVGAGHVSNYEMPLAKQLIIRKKKKIRNGV